MKNILMERMEMNKFYYLVVGLFTINLSVYCQNIIDENPFLLLSSDSSHFIYTQVNIQPNTTAKIYLTNKDSTWDYILFEDSNTTYKNVLITFEKFLIDAKKRFPSSKIVLQPNLESGLYYYIYEAGKKIYTHKFFYIK
jgi:hypothetical protein